MSLGLLVSAIANLIMGFTSTFIFFALCWGVNGWVQSMAYVKNNAEPIKPNERK